MQKQVLQYQDVLYEVQYEPGAHTEGPLFHSVRALDQIGNELVPVGPNMALTFNNLFVIQDDGSGQPLLSLLAGELECLTCRNPLS